MWRLLGFVLVTLVSATAAWAQPDPYSDPNVQPYYDDLRGYGTWVWVDPYGWVWSPNDVDSDWAPYSDGYWTYTDFGWYWNDYAAWGWAPFHYGRWYYTSRWVWIPGRVWGPAWVNWRWGADRCGWAPMPPAGVTYVASAAPGPHSGWRFVDSHHVLDHDVRHQSVPFDRDHSAWANTQTVDHHFGHGPEGPPRSALEHAMGHPVQVAHVTEQARHPDTAREIAHANPPSRATPTTAGPRTEQPRTGQPRTEQPRTEQPRTEQPRTEQPRTELPRTEPPHPAPVQHPQTPHPPPAPHMAPAPHAPPPHVAPAPHVGGHH